MGLAFSGFWETAWTQIHPFLKINRLRSQRFRYLLSTHLTGRLPPYIGEFGYELSIVVPYAHWLHRTGLLRQTQGFEGTRPLYFFSPDHLQVAGSRQFQTYLGWNRNPFGHHFRSLEWSPPDYKTFFRNDE